MYDIKYFQVIYGLCKFLYYLKAMLWKKTSTNYSKWDYFTDSEEEEKP
jgi:hypothetical protein